MVLTLALPVSVRAQYYSINVDYQTMAAMSEAYTTENAMEMLHNENLQKIYDSYKAAEVASAGIFASKYLDRKALTNLNLWNSEEENRYYKRIYNIVSRRIIPKTIQCAELMVKDPATAIYWGSFLLKTCEDVKSLCQQFESVVTNSSLSFKDIAFVEISDQLKTVFNITNLGSVDWKNLFEHLGDDIENAFTEENLKEDLGNLISKGVGLAGAGYTNGVNNLTQGSNFDGSFQEKLGSILTMVDNASNMYGEFKDLSTGQLLTTLMGEDNISNLFKASDYNLTRWITDYKDAAQGQYYTQRVYIYRRDYGSERLCSYEPPIDENSILYGDHWYRINTTDPHFLPSFSQSEAALQNSENHAGWSRAKVRELNYANPSYNYNIECYQSAYILSKSRSGQYAKAYAYRIYVNRSWDIRETVYEDVFDSYSMDWNTFMAQMNASLDQYNANGEHTEINSIDDLQHYIDTHPNETNYTYYIGYDARSYYTASDARKIAGASSATFTVTCHDGGSLGKGSTTYKCGSCGSSPGSHTKQCSMYTSLQANDAVQTNDLKNQKRNLEAQASAIQNRLDALNAENSELLRKMSKAANREEYLQYQSQYNANRDNIRNLQSQLDDLNRQIRDVENAILEAEEGEQQQTDDYTRIPALMQNMQNAYHITWTDNGSWSGYTFTRNGTVGSVKGTVTFKATVSIARKPKYFLGIKIHRAIVQIDWELTSDWEDSNVAEIMELDTNKSDDENARLVNQKISELKRQYPNCDVTVEYTKTPAVETEDTDGTHHLLWASDRLEIARGIEARLARIYTDLVMVEKFLHYKHSYKAWIKDLLPKLNADRDRKMSIAEQCRRRWMRLGGSQNAIYQEDEEE